jgi:hypothetical protein
VPGIGISGGRTMEVEVGVSAAETGGLASKKEGVVAREWGGEGWDDKFDPVGALLSLEWSPLP